MKTPLVLRYFIWSMLIFALSMALLSFRLLRPLELRTLNLAVLLRSGPYQLSMREVEAPYMTLPVYNSQLSQESYLRIAQDVVHQLRKAKAKVVIVPLPEYLESSPRIIAMIQEMSRDSIVVFGVQSPLNSPLNPWIAGGPLDDRRNWWVDRPLYRLKLPWGVMSAQSRLGSSLMRFVPTGFRESNTGEPVAEVAVLALRRFFDIPDEGEIQPSFARLPVGPYNIQLERDGLSYVKIGFSMNNWSTLYATIDPTTDSLSYLPTMVGYQPTTQELEKAWEAHKGKIVMLDWYGARRYEILGSSWTYMQIFGAIFSHSFVKVHNEWNVLLIITLVVLLSVFSYTFRNGLTVFVSLALAATTVVISLWLFKSHDVLFDPIYVLVPILLCGFILPITKLAGEKHMANETIKNLEAENRRLLDLKRSNPPESQI